MRNRSLIMIAANLLLAITACVNAQETGPTLHVDVDAVAEAGQVESVDGVTSSGQPDQAALEVFAGSGYAAVIDLRGENENRGMDEKAAVEALGMNYVPFPIADRDAISFENARKLDELIASYDEPVLIHCGSGDRVGALLALRQSLNGANNDEAIEHGRQGGMRRLEIVVRERLDSVDTASSESPD